MQKTEGKRPPRYDGKDLQEDIIERNAEARRRGEFVVPGRLPEYTQLEERAERGLERPLPLRIRRLIGKRVEIYWPKYKRWYPGEVVRYATGRDMFEILYDDYDEDTIYEKLLGAGAVKYKLL